MIEKFFTENDADYFACKLLPINYSIASNEDVFELIKYDLLSYLIENYYEDLNLEKEDFSLLLRSQMFIMEKVKFMPLLTAILGMNDKVGKPVVKLLEVMQKVIKNFKSFSEEIRIDEEESINDFLENIKNSKGNIYEMDATSRLINELLQRLKVSEENKESVLIIDDLDRLDPEHIFRLFNIFSSQEVYNTGINKFGFDKVIFICDIENIRKIFHHKYGSGVDFIGYIDKFYSICPFEFDNREYIRLSINKFIKEIRIKSSNYNIDKYEHFINTLTAIFISLIEAHILNLRILEKNKNFDIKEYHYYRGQSSESSPLIIIFQILKVLFGSYDIMKSKLLLLYELYDKETYSNSPEAENRYMHKNCTESLVSYIIPLLEEGNKSVNLYDNRKCLYFNKYKCYIHYNDANNFYLNFVFYTKATIQEDFNSEEVFFNPYQLLIDAYEICNSKGYLR